MRNAWWTTRWVSFHYYFHFRRLWKGGKKEKGIPSELSHSLVLPFFVKRSNNSRATATAMIHFHLIHAWQPCVVARVEHNSCFHRHRIIVANDYKRSPRNVRSNRMVNNGYLIWKLGSFDPYLEQNATCIIFLDEDRSLEKKNKKIKKEEGARFLESSKKIRGGMIKGDRWFIGKMEINIYLWYCVWRKLKSSLIRSQSSPIENLYCWPGCGGPWNTTNKKLKGIGWKKIFCSKRDEQHRFPSKNTFLPKDGTNERTRNLLPDSSAQNDRSLAIVTHFVGEKRYN